MSVSVVILAAGKSSRFKSETSKLLAKVDGVPLIGWVMNTALFFSQAPIVVLGHQKDKVLNYLSESFSNHYVVAEQVSQNGSGDAFLSSKPFWESENIIVLNGDTPFVTPQVLAEFVKFCVDKNLEASIISARAENPFGYGRVIEKNGATLIIEQKALETNEESVDLINGGIYFFKKSFLQSKLQDFILQNYKGLAEVNITNFFNLASQCGLPVAHYEVPFFYVRGINTLEQLNEAVANISPQIIENIFKRRVV